MQAIENGIGVPRVRANFIRFWFGRMKGLPSVDLVVNIAVSRAVVPIEGTGNLTEELQYGNHGSAKPYTQEILQKVLDDVPFGRVFIFPKNVASSIKGVAGLPHGCSAVLEKNPNHSRSLFSIISIEVSSVNADTYFATAPEVELGKVLRGIVWRILWLRKKFGTDARFVMNKIDVTGAFGK